MIRTRRSRYVTTANQCSPAIRPTTSHRGSPTVRAGTSTRFGSSHSACACACTKPIPCLIVFAALFSESNSNSMTSWYRNYTSGVEAAATTPALISDVSVPRSHPWPTTSTLTPGLGRGEHPAVTLSFLYRAFCRVLQRIRLAGRSDTDLAVEVVILRHEVAVLRRQVHRPAVEPADRAVLAGLARLLSRQRLRHLFVQPSTLLRWHRDLVAKHSTYPQHRPSRPAIPKGTTAVVLRSAKENPQWGYRRIHGELATMGIVIAASGVWAILKRHGVEPSPRRSGPSSSPPRRKG